FPGHDVIGEEMEERPGRGQDCVWAVDPIDGTTNFVNGFPMFAASIGVMHRGVPVAGAVWFSVSHALRAGVYHASIGAKWRFEGNDVTPRVNADVLRRLAGVRVAAHADEAGWGNPEDRLSRARMRPRRGRTPGGRALFLTEYPGRGRGHCFGAGRRRRRAPA